MKSKLLSKALVIAAGMLAPSLWAQAPGVPGRPEDNGATPLSNTAYINVPTTVNNNSTESVGVAITSNENIVVGWEDDGDGVTDLEAVWTLFDKAGNHLTPNTVIT